MSDKMMTHKIGDVPIEDKGKVSLTLNFASVSAMVKWSRLSLPESQQIRPEDALDKVNNDRRFVADTTEEPSRLRTFVTTEI